METVLVKCGALRLLTCLVAAQSTYVAMEQAPNSPATRLPERGLKAASPHETKANDTRKEMFKRAMTNVVLEGYWQVTKSGSLKGALSEPKSEKYTIESVVNAGGDNWIILARVQFGDKDVTLPIPVRVIWAEDTAIITLTKLGLPGLGNYSARVMVHEGYYSGVWYNGSKTYGGVLSGRLVPANELKEKTGDKTKPKP